MPLTLVADILNLFGSAAPSSLTVSDRRAARIGGQMFLSSKAVLNEIRRQHIAVDPFDAARLDESGHLTLTLSSRVRRVRSESMVIDARRITPDLFTEEEMSADDGLTVWPGEFVLLETAERLVLKAASYDYDTPIGCLLSTRPKLAQIGLDVVQSSTFVPPGSDCRLTLETFNHGPSPIRIYPGLEVVKAAFYLYLAR